MNQWLNDTNPVSNGHAASGSTPDLPMSFPQQPQTINPAQFQNQPYLNGTARTSSPGFHPPVYQTNSVIPSKRSREDSLGISPRLSHNAPPSTRAPTPGQGPYPGYNPQVNGATPFTGAPTPFQHLQTSNNATPSPTMQQMGFVPGAAVQRVATVSPSPFSPQHNMSGASPGPSDRATRVGTPHDNPQNFLQNPGFNPQQFAQGIPGQLGMGQMAMSQQQMSQGAMNAANNYKAQLERQAHQLQAQRGANGMTPRHPGQMGMGQINTPDQQSTPQPRPMQNTPESFFRALQQFSAAKGRPFDMTPQICGRPIEVLRLYQAIFKGGGSGRITKLSQWPTVAQVIQFPPQLLSQAAVELQQWWLNNVGTFEQMWLTQQQRNRAAAQQMSPTRDGQMPGNINHQRNPSDLVQAKLDGQGPAPGSMGMNGFQAVKETNDHSSSHQRTPSRQLDGVEMPGTPQNETPQKRPSTAVVKPEPEPELAMPPQKSIEDPFVPEVLSPSRHHGMINVEDVFGLCQQVMELKPTVPTLRELGVVDIHALTMSIKSGMHGETRNALDTLVTLSSEPSLQLQLDLCDDLMETLVDCAQVEVDLLAEHASEVSDEISLSSYEELVRACHTEAKGVQSIPAFGSLDYDLDRAADRLICITTLIRNFSFYEPNFVTLGQSEVLQLVTRVIQHIGTKDMPLRTSRNTLDFMKDIIIYLSNLSSSLHLPSKQDALCLLHFLLSFAPAPSPISHTNERILFPQYNPSVHKYLPPAVDSIAKLLARDEPNRVFFKAIFVADGHASTPYELLTRTFGLVIAPVPSSASQSHLRALIEARKPFLLQGMLAAEILAVLSPGSEKPLARNWLQSEDCFAGNLLKMASTISTLPGSANNARQQSSHRNAPQRALDDDPQANGSIVNRTMAVLRILVNKSRTVDREGNTSAVGIPGSIIMKRDLLLAATLQKEVDASTLKLFSQYSQLED